MNVFIELIREVRKEIPNKYTPEGYLLLEDEDGDDARYTDSSGDTWHIQNYGTKNQVKCKLGNVR